MKNISVVLKLQEFPKQGKERGEKNNTKQVERDQKVKEGEGHYSVTQSLVEDSPPSTGIMKVLPY